MHDAWPKDLAWALPEGGAAPLDNFSLASTRVPELRAWLATLPPEAPTLSAARLLRLLDELTRLRIDTRRRLALLEEVRPWVCRLLPVLQSHYLDAPLSLPQAARRSAEQVQDLFETLARGYQQVAAALLASTPGPARRQAAATAVQRALDALGQRLWQYWLLYSVAEPGLWWRLHRLYATAEYQGLQALTVADPEAPGHESSVHDAYARVLLVASAQPQQLRPAALVALYRAAGHWGRWLTLDAAAAAGGFQVILDQDRGPAPADHDGGPRCRHFDTRTLARALAGDGRPGPLPSLLLAHLRTVWSVPRDRQDARRPSEDRLTVVLGLNGAHACLEQPAHRHDAAPAYCLDRNEQGCGLIWPGATPDTLRVGAVLALGGVEEAAPWRVGEVRWLAREPDGVRLGVRLLPADARPVRISHGYGDTLPTPALLLPAAAGDTLLVPTAGFASGARITVWDGPPRLARLGGRVDGSAEACRYRLRWD